MSYVNTCIKENIYLKIMNDSLIDNILFDLSHVFPLDTTPRGRDVYIT